MLTRSDFRIIASALNQEYKNIGKGNELGFFLAVDAIKEALADCNPRFDNEKFSRVVFDR